MLRFSNGLLVDYVSFGRPVSPSSLEGFERLIIDGLGTVWVRGRPKKTIGTGGGTLVPVPHRRVSVLDGIRMTSRSFSYVLFS